MTSYPALVEWDENAGAYGAVFPDLDISAVGVTLEDTLVNATEMLHDYVMEMESRGWTFAQPSPMQEVDVPEGATLVWVPLALPSKL